MKPLIQTNPYLSDKTHREASNARSARTSCGVEGIKVGASSSSLKNTKSSKVLRKIKKRLARD